MTISGLGGSTFAGVRGYLQPPSFASLDTNNDATIILDELKAGAPGGANSKSASGLDALFKAMDTDGSGGVSSDEKAAFDEKLQARRQDHHAGLVFMAQQLTTPTNADVFAATDTNGDGSVNLDELSNDPAAANESTDSLQKLFNMIDSNADGSISQTESSDFLDKVRSAVATLSHSDGPHGAGAPPPPPPPLDTTDATDATSATDTTATVDAASATDTSGNTDTSSQSTDTADASTSLADQLMDLLTRAQNAYSESSSSSLVAMLQQLVQKAA